MLIVEEVAMTWEFSHFSAEGMMNCSAFSSADNSFDVGLVESYNSLFYGSCEVIGSREIDFNTHFRTPFFSSTIVGPSSMYIGLLLSAFTMAS